METNGLILPSGDSNLEQDLGGIGIQTNLALSVVLNRKFATHWNAGATLVPNARNANG